MIKNIALHAPSLSVSLTFMSLSLLFGSWLARMPEVQSALMLTEGQLGIALLGMPLGALIMMPFSSYLASRLTTGTSLQVSTILFCLAAPIPALSTGIWSLAGGLFLVGVTNSFMNISMNAAAAAVEKTYMMSIMSACHGMFSLGAMIGAGSAGIIASMGVPLHLHLFIIGGLLIILQLVLRNSQTQLPNQEYKRTKFSWPPAALWGLAFIGFCIMIGEGAVADWSAIYLTHTLSASPLYASLGYAGFSLAMAIGRFSGDSFKEIIGSKTAIVAGSLLGALGILIAIASPAVWLAILGFTLVGLGFSTVIPLIFSKAAGTPGVVPSTGIAAIAGSGIIGFLIAPPAIGILSEYFGLNIGLGVVAILAFFAALVAYRIR
jgi:MFS family permease